MSDDFDPYAVWLKIPRRERPPTHYRLLGLEAFEDDAEAIRAAGRRQIEYVRRFALSEYADHSQEVLNELAAALACLVDPAKKSAYDRQLRESARERLSPAREKPAATAAQAVQRLPSPDAASLAQTERLVKKVFGPARTAARSRLEVLNLAERLLAQGRQPQTAPAHRFALLKEAIAISTETGNASLALAASGDLVGQFHVDTVAEETAVLRALSKTVQETRDRTRLAEAALELSVPAVEVGRFSDADWLAATAAAQAATVRNALLEHQASLRGREIALAKGTHRAFRDIEAGRSQGLDEPQINLVVGRFHAFNQRDWQRGLPYLAECGNAELREAAREDLLRPGLPLAQSDLGDRWLAVAAAAADGERRCYRAAALYWYCRAFSDAADVLKPELSAKIDQLGDVPPQLRRHV